MSFLASEWASEAAPVADTYERIILMKLASHAGDDGRHAHPSVPSMARAALCDTETVKRRLRSMLSRELISYGDQQRVAHYRADRRPKVYDLMIPAAWYSDEQLTKVNRQCAEEGVEPVTPRNRPRIAPAPAKPQRADKGVSNLKRSPKALATGALAEPSPAPVDNPVIDGHGGSDRAVDGGSLSGATGALQEPQISQITRPKETSQTDSGTAPRIDVGTACLPAGSAQTKSNTKSPIPGTSGARLLQHLNVGVTAQVIRQHHQKVDELLQTWPEQALIDHLERETSGPRVQNPMGLLVAVLRDTEPYQAPVSSPGPSAPGHGTLPPPCGQCDARPGDSPCARRVETDSGSARCPRCHPSLFTNQSSEEF